ncbi:MAG TPA: carbohydrate ABC transporter permease [Ktedonobacteraceae bacterium]|jgi:multiple sugar transport system permease protein|nr:carbohydrate ABC transporter permease [Ktedonobacteraceae bacterium]
MSQTASIARARVKEQAIVKASHTGQPIKLSGIIAMIFLFISTIYFIVPFLWLLISSTKSTGDLFGTFGLWFAPSFNLFANLQQLFTYDNSVYLQWLLNSLIYAGIGSIIAMFLSSLAGYALAKYVFRGRDFIFSCVLGAILVPTTALALPLYLLMSKWGLTNTYWSVLLPSIVSPFGVYLSRIYASASVPDELIEAARIDGAGEMNIFVTIAMRLMTPALVTVLLFQFVAIWNNYFLPLVMLSNERLFPITLGLQTWNVTTGGVNKFLYTQIVTGALISSIPLIIGCILLQRFWKGGLGVGGVKN